MIAPCKDCAERHVGCHESAPGTRSSKPDATPDGTHRAGRYVIMDYTVDTIKKQRRLAHNRRRK